MDGEAWLTSELASFACAGCGQAYGQERIRLIAQREELFFLDLACGYCGSQAVAIVTIQIDEEMATTEAGELVVQKISPVSADDVLDMHGLLRDFGGDAHDLLARLDGQAG